MAESNAGARGRRSLVYKDSGATLAVTRLQQVEHEALCQLVAAQAGAHVPDVVAAGMAGPGAALLVTGPVDGVELACVEDPAMRWSRHRRVAETR